MLLLTWSYYYEINTHIVFKALPNAFIDREILKKILAIHLCTPQARWYLSTENNQDITRIKH